jgi:7-cyano-7-deazaguanine reductase
MDPRYIEVKGIFMPRGGISIYPFANWGDDEHKELCLRRREQNFPQIGK